jgi:hypothetical protein
MAEVEIRKLRWRMLRTGAARWATENPILGPGELGFEIDTFKIKAGNGLLRWNDLP